MQAARLHYCELDGDSGVCWAYYLPVGVPIGDPCADDTACGENGTCLTEWQGTTFPDGYCAANEADFCCPEGTEPVGFEEEADFYCVKGCQSAADCRTPEYECTPAQVCYPPGEAE